MISALPVLHIPRQVGVVRPFTAGGTNEVVA